MNWVVFIIGMFVAVTLRMLTPDNFHGFYPSMLVAFATGVAFGIMTMKQRIVKAEMIPPNMIELRRMAIRMSYLMQEGTLSKTGDVVRFDAEGSGAANEFMDAVVEIGNLGR